jgi:hypothetical protein
MIVFVQLTTVGSDSGPFTIFSNTSLTTPVGSANATEIQTGVSVTVPDNTAFVRVLSTGKCTNYIDLPIGVTPTTCSSFYVNASVKTVITYKDCETGNMIPEGLLAGESLLIPCAYKDPRPYFVDDKDGIVEEEVPCGSGRPGCTQTTLFATAGEGGAVFRIFECESNLSTTVTLADGATSNRCVRNDVGIQLVSGVGNFTQGSACTV